VERVSLRKPEKFVKEMSGSKVFIVTDKGIRQANLLESIEQSFCHEIQSAGVSGKDERYC
jgi:alcohol dehydrogenase class IV